MSSIYDIAVTGADGRVKSMADYRGDVLLVVNVASQCGFTPQYAGLEALHRRYRERGLRVLAFPSNDFGAQEPGTIEEIQQFCQMNYDVTFELLAKVHAIGDGMHPLYQWLTSQESPQADVRWNFEKFLVSRSGELIARYSSKVAPDDPELTGAIESALT